MTVTVTDTGELAANDIVTIFGGTAEVNGTLISIEAGLELRRTSQYSLQSNTHLLQAKSS